MRKFISAVLSLTLSISPASMANTTHNPQQFLESIAGKPEEGSLIVDHFCASCHAVNPIIEMHAPTAKDKTAWDPRLKKGFQQLLEHTIHGINAMPPRGGCFECSDNQLILAILELLPTEAKDEYISSTNEHK